MIFSSFFLDAFLNMQLQGRQELPPESASKKRNQTVVVQSIDVFVAFDSLKFMFAVASAAV